MLILLEKGPGPYPRRSDDPSHPGGLIEDAAWSALASTVKLVLGDAVEALVDAFLAMRERLGVDPPTPRGPATLVDMCRLYSAARHVLLACGRPVALHVVRLISVDRPIANDHPAADVVTHLVAWAAHDLAGLDFADVQVYKFAASFLAWALDGNGAQGPASLSCVSTALELAGDIAYRAETERLVVPASLENIVCGLRRVLEAPAGHQEGLRGGLAAVAHLLQGGGTDRALGVSVMAGVRCGAVETSVRTSLAAWSMSGALCAQTPSYPADLAFEDKQREYGGLGPAVMYGFLIQHPEARARLMPVLSTFLTRASALKHALPGRKNALHLQLMVASGLSGSSDEPVCASAICPREGDTQVKLKLCSACKLVLFCSSACQRCAPRLVVIVLTVPG